MTAARRREAQGIMVKTANPTTRFRINRDILAFILSGYLTVARPPRHSPAG